MKTYKTPRYKTVKTVLLVGFICVIGGSVFYFNRASGATPDAVPVTEEIALKLLTILTAENPEFSFEPWYLRLLRKAPEKVQKLVKPYTRGQQYSLNTFMGVDGQVMPLFEYNVPEQWTNLPTSDLLNRVNGAVEKTGLLSMRLTYDNGWNSAFVTISIKLINYGAMSGTAEGLQLLNTTCFTVPANQKHFGLEIWKNAFEHGTTNTKLGSLRVRNPLFTKLQKLTTPKKLPQSVQQQDVEVELKAFVAKANGEQAFDADFNWDTSELSVEDFRKADGSLTDNYYGLAAFEVKEPGESSSQWSVHEVCVSYGNPVRPFPTATYINTYGNTHIVSFSDDPGMLQQPVKLTASLRRSSRFLDDEMAKFEIPLSPSGTNTLPGRSVNFWTGNGNVAVVYKSPTEYESVDVGSGEALWLIQSGAMQHAEVLEAKLTNALGMRLDIADTEDGWDRDDNFLISRFYIENAKSWAGLRGALFNGETTLSLTLAMPRPYPGTFEFIAEPLQAEGTK